MITRDDFSRAQFGGLEADFGGGAAVHFAVSIIRDIPDDDTTDRDRLVPDDDEACAMRITEEGERGQWQTFPTFRHAIASLNGETDGIAAHIADDLADCNSLFS